MRAIERIWYGSGLVPAAARALLWPFAQAYRGVVSARARLYDRGVLRVDAPALPSVSVGNLTVGGTGKTPVAAWVAARLSQWVVPAIVLRGYGEDEIDVHRVLNPHIPVVTGADRLAAAREAQSRDAQVVVFDDAFQHRRASRAADIVLVSAEQLQRPVRLLPAGPWRESLAALRRADLVIVTRKAASPAEAQRAAAVVRHHAPHVPTAVVHLEPHSVVSLVDGVAQPLAVLNGAAVLAIAAVGEPEVFAAQLESLGARVTLLAFRDHHAFTDADVRAAAARVPPGGFAVCTLKDAVKLARRWPGSSRLWYVSQHLVVEQGGLEIDGLLRRVLDARVTTMTSAG